MLAFQDHRLDPAGWARELGISREAVELYLASDVVDLHVDTFIWTRVFGYRLDRRHGRGPLGARLFSQVDLPRVREAAITGCVWSVTTNPFRRASRRPALLARNLARLRAVLEACSDDVAICRTADDYRRARTAGKHAAFFGVQGGNALDPSDTTVLRELLRVTLVHFTRSPLGASSAARAGTDGRLTAHGTDVVRALDAARVFVDLAHIHRRGFFDAVAAHDRSLPLMVSHTGVSALAPHWRNIDDEQVRSIADTGGIIGVMYQTPILGGSRAETVVAHLDHIISAVGEDHAALGSDWDGMILPPRDMPTCLELPRLVEIMLARRWSPARVSKVLGGNFVRVLSAMR